MKNYTQEAKDTLAKMGVKFSAKFIKHGVHFVGETEERDIFRVSLWRGEAGMSLRFGQSIAQSTGNGVNIPTEYDVLASITKHDVGTFSDFVSEFGYSIDTPKEKRNAEKIYKAVVDEWESVKNLFTEEELEIIREIN